jgi:hypothetical protein
MRFLGNVIVGGSNLDVDLNLVIGHGDLRGKSGMGVATTIGYQPGYQGLEKLSNHLHRWNLF